MNSIAELPQNERQALQDFKSGIPCALPGCGFRLTLFGSKASGDDDPDSDTDIAAGHRFVQAVEDRIKSWLSTLKDS